jgi:hypothetical protein
MLATVFPEYEWLPWKLERCPRGFWDDINNQRKFLDWVSKELKIEEFSDWYKVTKQVYKAFSMFNKRTSPIWGAGGYCAISIKTHLH